LGRFRVRDAAPDVRAAWGVPSEARLVAHLSHIGPDRRQEVMLEAFSLLAGETPRMRLVFLGQGNRDTVRRLKRRVAAGPLADRILFSRDFAEKALPWPNQIAAVDLVAVLAVGSEGSSRGVMEAMALAKPVVGAGLGVIPELLENGKTGWIVNPDEPPQVATAMREALADAAKSHRLATAASAAVRSRFRCERQAEEMLGLYREVLGAADRSLPAAGSR
jgi:glycosyltransferase involved in cell wall biosynthesis